MLYITKKKKSPLTHLIDPGAGTRALLRYVGGLNTASCNNLKQQRSTSLRTTRLFYSAQSVVVDIPSLNGNYHFWVVEYAL